jgi:hypothetical protein
MPPDYNGIVSQPLAGFYPFPYKFAFYSLPLEFRLLFYGMKFCLDSKRLYKILIKR